MRKVCSNIGEQPTSSEYSENMKERSVEDRTLPVAPLSEPKKLFTLPRRKPLNEAAIERFLERYKHKVCAYSSIILFISISVILLSFIFHFTTFFS